MRRNLRRASFHTLSSSGLRVTFRLSHREGILSGGKRICYARARAPFSCRRPDDLITDRLVSRLWIADWQTLVRHDRLGTVRRGAARRNRRRTCVSAPLRCRCNCELFGLTTPVAEARSRPGNCGARCRIHSRVIFIARPSGRPLANRHNLFRVSALNRHRAR